MGFTLHGGICQRFEALADVQPNALAIFDVGTGRSLSYAEANRRANQFARCLSKAGIAEGSVVALRLDRSVELITCVLAVLKSGGA